MENVITLGGSLGGFTMCEQTKVLMLVKNNRGLNKQQLALAEAQAKDYMSMKHRLDQIESTVDSIQKKQIEQDAKFDLIIQRLNSPVEQERKDGIIWNEIRAALKSWKGWALIVFFLMSVALAGEKLSQLLHWIPTGV